MENKQLDQFLENWKQSAIAYYTQAKQTRNQLHDAYWNCEDKQERIVRKNEYERYCRNLGTRGYEMTIYGDKYMIEQLDKEVKAKKRNLIERVEKQVGNILDASYLTVDNTGNLNGIVIGENGKCNVETIGAGGYNVQIYHYRVLVKKIK